MLKFRWLLVLVLVPIAGQSSFADDSAKIVGIWRIVSYEWETRSTGEREPLLGKNPSGYIIFTPEGRMMVVLTAEGRKIPNTDQDRAGLLNSMIAYTGIYRLEGDKWITKIDVAWAPARVGTENMQFFRIDGDRIQVMSGWMPVATRTEKGMGRNIAMFERVK